MEHLRQNTRGSVPQINFDNTRQDSEPSFIPGKSRSKSPLCSFKESSSTLISSTDFTKTEDFGIALSKSQNLSSNQQKARKTQNTSYIEAETRQYTRTSDILRKHEGKRTGSMQIVNFNEMSSKEASYKLGPPQSLQTICNGNNLPSSQTQSSERNISSNTNTLGSATASGTTSISSHCKNCKRVEEQEKMLTYLLNRIMNQINDMIDKEQFWRQGVIGFGLNNFVWLNEEDRMPDVQLLKKTESGRLVLEMQKKVIEMRSKFEELIVDVENLSKTNLYKNINIQKKDDLRRQAPADSSLGNQSSGKKLLASIADAKQYIDSLKSVVFSEDIPSQIKEEIKQKNKQESVNKNILRTLILQLEQSKRERIILETEINLQKKRIPINSSSLKQVIRQVIEEEIKLSHEYESL